MAHNDVCACVSLSYLLSFSLSLSLSNRSMRDAMMMAWGLWN